MEYGQQPVAFNQSWHNMYYLVKAVAPETVMVWAPNTPQGYPYGQNGNAYTSLSAADQALLDTNQNGQLDAGDDPFGPYYPGDDVVDWIGLSVCALACLLVLLARSRSPRSRCRLQGYSVRHGEQ